MSANAIFSIKFCPIGTYVDVSPLPNRNPQPKAYPAYLPGNAVPPANQMLTCIPTETSSIVSFCTQDTASIPTLPLIAGWNLKYNEQITMPHGATSNVQVSGPLKNTTNTFILYEQYQIYLGLSNPFTTGTAYMQTFPFTAQYNPTTASPLTFQIYYDGLVDPAWDIQTSNGVGGAYSHPNPADKLPFTSLAMSTNPSYTNQITTLPCITILTGGDLIAMLPHYIVLSAMSNINLQAAIAAPHMFSGDIVPYPIYPAPCSTAAGLGTALAPAALTSGKCQTFDLGDYSLMFCKK